MIVHLQQDNREVNLSITVKDNEYYLTDANQLINVKLTDQDEIMHFDNDADLSLFSDDVQYLVNELKRESIDYFYNVKNGIENFGDGEGDPFDPRKISIDKKIISMDVILRRLEQKTIILNPDFQRNEVWQDDRKSRLIESLLLKIPIPMFYVSSDENGVWTVVDGLQRISTIRDFVLGKDYLIGSNRASKGKGLKLKGLEFWKNLEGSNMNELPINLSNRLLETEFSFTIINPGTPEDVKRNIFKRINTGGMPLSSQEIRNALYGGTSTELLNVLSENDSFKDVTGFKIKPNRMEDRELILCFLSFLIRDYKWYEKSVTADTWLSDTMVIINAFPNLDSHDFKKLLNAKKISKETINIISNEDIVNLFELAMKRAKMLFGSSAFRKSLPGMKRTPINKTLFEIWSNILSKLDADRFEMLLKNKDAFFAEYANLFEDNKFILSISRVSMQKASVEYRYEQINKLINNYTKV